MKIVGFSALHYGKDFLKQALESVKNVVDYYVIIYSKAPSYGFNSELHNPDTEKQLHEIADSVLGSKLIWKTFEKFRHEGQHRNTIYQFCNQDDLIIVTDADEIWDNPQDAIYQALETEAHSFMINGFVNFWKSLDYIVRDGFQPVRILRPKYQGSTTINSKIYHLGYMISPEAMRYKLEIHGHRNDIDQVHGSPENYFNKWNNWKHPDCGIKFLHPASRDIWQDAEVYNGEKPNL